MLMNLAKNIVKICDVTLRDGIQNLKSKSSNVIFPVSNKYDIVNSLKKANINDIEIGSNVSHKITEMKNTNDLVNMISDLGMNLDNNTLSVLIPSYKKYMEMKNWTNVKNIKKLSLITASSSSFIKQNTNMTLVQNLDEIDKILDDVNINTRIYISTCFGCPFEGPTNFTHIQNMNTIFQKYSSNSKVEEIVISDTIGTYNSFLIDEYMHYYGVSNKVSLHIHSKPDDPDIYSIIDKYKYNLVSIDTSLGNLGGCPSVKSKLKPNLSTFKVASIINKTCQKDIYDLDQLIKLEFFVRNTIDSNDTETK